MSEETLDRLAAIIRRDLGADDVRVGDAADAELADHEIGCELPDGRILVAVFPEPPADRAARRRRLEMIVASFPGIAKVFPAPHAHARSLGDELATVSERAGALHALVIDATSPVVWGADHASAPREDLDVDIETARLFETANLAGLDLGDLLARELPLASPNLDEIELDAQVVGFLRREIAERYRVIPVAFEDGKLVIATADPTDGRALEHLRLVTGLEVEPVLAGPREIERAIQRTYTSEIHEAQGPERDDILEPASMKREREPFDPEETAVKAVDPGQISGSAIDPDLTAVSAIDLEQTAMNAARPEGSPPPDPSAPLPDHQARAEFWRQYLLVKKAIAAVRILPAISSLKKGDHLHESLREEGFGYLARSFATIYVLVLVFDGPYEELRAERAVAHALPVIERLVLALPPLDPPPKLAGVVAIRRGRPRRR